MTIVIVITEMMMVMFEWKRMLTNDVNVCDMK